MDLQPACALTGQMRHIHRAVVCRFALVVSLVALGVSAPVAAQEIRTKPPVEGRTADPVPAARDLAFPGTIGLAIDATDTVQGVFKVVETVPVPASLPVPGKMTLLFPAWLPGNHAPRGQIEKLAGLYFTAGGKTLDWVRDPYDINAFTVNVPAGAKSIEARFNFLSATTGNQGRIVMTADMLNLQPNSMSLYPAGYYTRNIPVSTRITWPQGWQAAGALRTAAGAAPPATGTVTYETTDYETLVDSPFFAGRWFKRWDLGQNVALNVVADEERFLEAKPEYIEAHKKLVDQAVKTFGARHFDHYDFLLALTGKMGGIGLEHHRSSENGVGTGYFTSWATDGGTRDLLPHEMTHSWNGKFRRGMGTIVPDFRTPLRNEYLWVYEGQTQFWGYVLAARSGLIDTDYAIDELAMVAASLDNTPGRRWRPLIDTTNDPVMSARAPKGWRSEERSEDYYNEGLLIWLEIDSVLRRETKGRRGIDDFARAFFGVRDGDWGVLPYDETTITGILNGLAPYDWAGLLKERLRKTSNSAPLAGFAASGYALEYSDTPSKAYADVERGGTVGLSYSGGLALASSGRIASVVWDSAAYKAGLKVDDVIIAVDGRPYSGDILKARIKDANGGTTPILLTVKTGDRVREVPLAWHGGLRYPKLVRKGSGPDWLAQLLKPLP